MKNKGLTLTIISNISSNYGEGLGNMASIQKVYKNGKAYGIRSKESMKNALMIQSGLYDDLKTCLNKTVAQKEVNEEVNASNSRALEGGYMNTSGVTRIRRSSFYLTDAIAFEPFVNELRFHNNLYLAQTSAKEQGINLQEEASKAGLMPYQYEFSRSLKKYSITIDLDKIGVDEEFSKEADIEEKIFRVNSLLEAVKNLSLAVKGNLDNAEPIFIIGGIGNRKTHYFENVVNLNNDQLMISKDMISRLDNGYSVGLLEGDNFTNEEEIKSKLKPISMEEFFNNLFGEVKEYYGSSKD